MRIINYFIGACVLFVSKISSAAFISTDDQTELLLMMLEKTESD